VTIANPQLAPYGHSAKAYLQAQNSYETMVTQKRLIQAENIGQAFQYTHTGSVDYGFVALAQLIAIKAKPTQFHTLAPNSYPSILQDGIVLSERPSAAGFSEYLRSEAGQQYFADAGYLPVQ
jgi:molybdate transport system substrate-binding protein